MVILNDCERHLLRNRILVIIKYENRMCQEKFAQTLMKMSSENRERTSIT